MYINLLFFTLRNNCFYVFNFQKKISVLQYIKISVLQYIILQITFKKFKKWIKILD